MSLEHPWHRNKWTRMPGRRPQPHTLFSQWMWKMQLTDRKLAHIIGCHGKTIQRIRAGRRASPLIVRMLHTFYPDCPVPRDGRQTIYERTLPLPEPVKKPNVLHLERDRRDAYYEEQGTEPAKPDAARRSKNP